MSTEKKIKDKKKTKGSTNGKGTSTLPDEDTVAEVKTKAKKNEKPAEEEQTTFANMDDAGDAAAKAFDKMVKNLDKEAVTAVATWMKTWYLKAGYKRLSKHLLTHASK
jgi:hypothetical protein